MYSMPCQSGDKGKPDRNITAPKLDEQQTTRMTT